MSQYSEGPTRTFAAGGALGQFLRVKTPGALALAGSTDVEIGTMEEPAFASGDHATVRLRTASGTCKMVASEPITADNPVYAAASGKIAASGTVLIGTALESASGDGSIIEVLRRQEASDFAAAGGTTASAFVVDSDASTPKIELAAQTAGTGDFKSTIKPPATLTTNQVATLPDLTGNVLLDTTFEATGDDAEGAGNVIPAGVMHVDVVDVTNGADDFIVLPALDEVPVGFAITVVGNAGSNFEVRTPAGSAEEINSEDCDGTKEYLFTDTQIHVFTKISDTIGWMGRGYTALGAAVTPVVPD